MPPRDKAANAELAVRAKASQAQYSLPRAWAPASRRFRRRMASKRGRRLIDKAEVIARLGISYPTIWKLMNEGCFPRSVALAEKSLWYEDEIDEFIASLPRRVLKTDKRQTLARIVEHVARTRNERSPMTQE
jgi:predicted DNA-binding transcriptional regulator AlpA